MDSNREEDYLELEELGKELSVPIPMTYIGIKVEMDGQILEDRQERSHTWVRNGYNQLVTQLMFIGGTNNAVYEAGALNLRLTSGTVSYNATPSTIGNIFEDWNSGEELVVANQYYSGIRGGAGLATYGIVVGTGANAYSFEDYKLQTVVAHGNSATQLAYAEQQAAVKAYVAGTRTWTITHTRVFNNNTVNPIVITETAIYCNGAGGGGAALAFMPLRDVLDTPVSVGAGATLTLSYIFTLAFPA